MSSYADRLILIQNLRATIEEQYPNYVLSTTNDADYFRALIKKKPLPDIKTSLKSELKQDKIDEKTAHSFLPDKIAKSAQNENEAPITPIKPIPEEPLRKKIELPPLSTPKKESVIMSSFVELRKLVSTVHPNLTILNEIPSDVLALKISERWKTKNQTAPISVLSFQEQPEQKALLEEITRAIDIYFGPAKMIDVEKIEKEKQWGTFLSVDGLKMIIVCDYTLWQLSSLMQFYKENPVQGTRTLKTVPLFLLPDLSLYLKDPHLKRSLWKALCQKFS